MGRPLGSGHSTVVTRRDLVMPDMEHTVCQAALCSQFGVSLADSLADATADDTSLLIQAHVQYQCGTEGSTVEKPAETQVSIRLASHLVRAPIS